MKQRAIYYFCKKCGAKMWFLNGFIPDKFYCTTCEKEYLAKDIFKGLKEQTNDNEL